MYFRWVATCTTLAGLACGGQTPRPSPESGPEPAPRIMPSSQVFVLEMSGVPPEDTSYTFPAGQPRTIVVRHAPPDNNIFAEVAFPAEAFAGGPDSVTATLQVMPGIYGLRLSLSATPVARLSVRFKYPVHFSAPLGAIRRYGSRARFEQSLAVAAELDDDRLALLPSTHPAPDNLAANVPGSGTYLVVGPR